MALFKWLASFRTYRNQALSLYRSGMAKAEKKDFKGAIADYSEAAKSKDIPTDIEGMILYNRALAYSAIGEDEIAANDLAAMLKIPDLPENVKTAAHRRRERIRIRIERETIDN